MRFEKALGADISAIVALLDEGKRFLREQEIPQWQTEDFALLTKEAVERGEQYLVRDGERVVGVCVVQSYERDYEQIEGSWLTDGRYFAVHRVTVSAEYRGKGVPSFIYSALVDLARARKVGSLRADTHEKNLRMQRVFAKNGFLPCGVVTIASGEKFLAFERVIK